MNNFAFNTIKGSLNLITGCGSGLGKATLARFLKQGSGPILGIDMAYEVDFVDSLELTRDQKKLLSLKTIRTFDDGIEDAMFEFVAKYGAFHNVINVAGVALAYQIHTKNNIYNIEHADNLLKFNTVGTFNIIRLASKFMIQESQKSEDALKRNRCIINTSCISTTKPSLGQSFYAASKSALDSMTLVLARELSPYNIRCNTINVGYFNTRLLREASDEFVKLFLASEASLTPRRLGNPEDFAHLAEKIIENQMINASCIKLDAGAVPAL